MGLGNVINTSLHTVLVLVYKIANHQKHQHFYGPPRLTIQGEHDNTRTVRHMCTELEHMQNVLGLND